MADYFVDFSLPTNGDGSVSSPWNQFTTSEHPTLSGIDDKVWFRRVDPGVGNKIITMLEGSATHFISYIGWPLANDSYYDIRPTPPSTDWDNDTLEYTYQQLSTTLHVLNALNYTKIYRFYIKNTYYSSSYQIALNILSKSNVTIENCLLTYSYVPNTLNYNYSRVLRIENANNISIVNCILKSPTNTSLYPGCLLRIYNSNYVTFNDCYFYTYDTTLDVNYTYIYGYRTNNISDSNFIEFNGCKFYSYFNTNKYSLALSTTQDISYIYFYNSNISFNTTSFIFDNQDNDTQTKDFIVYPTLFALYSDTSTINLNDTSIIFNHIKHGLLVASNSDVNCYNLYIDCPTLTQNVVFKVNSGNSIFIDTISGTLNTEQGIIDNTNYLFGFTDTKSFIDSVNCVNVPYRFSNIIDLTSVNEVITLDNGNNILDKFTLYLTTNKSFFVQQSALNRLVFYTFSYNTTNYIKGAPQKSNIYIDISKSNVTGSPFVTLADNFSNNIEITAYNNDGYGGSLLATDSIYHTYKLKFIRNNGFTGIGNYIIGGHDILYSSLNNFDYGKTLTKTYDVDYITTDVYRDGGAGYAISVSKNNDDNVTAFFPIIGDDNIWAHIPDQGTYKITIYCAYTTYSGTFSNNDISMFVDVSNNTNEVYRSTSIEEDTSSIWHNVSGATYIKLSTTFSTIRGQYCSIRIGIDKYLQGNRVYVDPKVDVIQI